MPKSDQPPSAHCQPTCSDSGSTTPATMPAVTVIVRLNRPVISGICLGVRCLITGAAKVLAKPIANVSNNVPVKNPNQVGITVRIIIPAVNNPIIAISVFSSPKRLPIVGEISAPTAKVSIGTAPSQPIWVSEILSASLTTGAIEPSATIGARILVASKIMAHNTSQKVKREDGSLNADEVSGRDCGGKSEELDIAARLLE